MPRPEHPPGTITLRRAIAQVAWTMAGVMVGVALVAVTGRFWGGTGPMMWSLPTGMLIGQCLVAATVTVTPEHLTARSIRRRQQVSWSQVCDVRAAKWAGRIELATWSGKVVTIPAGTLSGTRKATNAKAEALRAWWLDHAGEEPPLLPTPVAPAPPPSSKEVLWAAGLSASVYGMLLPIAPLIALKTVGRSSPFIAAHAKATLNACLCFFAYGAASLLGAMYLPSPLALWAIFPLIGVVLAVMVTPWLSAARALRGLPPSWPLVFRLVR